jgi:mRNA interferase MazF
VVMKRFDVFLTHLDPSIGSEIQKTRPAVIVSPDEMNEHLRTVIIAPLTSTIKDYPFRVATVFAGRNGSVALDQIRVVDTSRLGTRLGAVDDVTGASIFQVLQAMFSL